MRMFQAGQKTGLNRCRLFDSQAAARSRVPCENRDIDRSPWEPSKTPHDLPNMFANEVLNAGAAWKQGQLIVRCCYSDPSPINSMDHVASGVLHDQDDVSVKRAADGLQIGKNPCLFWVKAAGDDIFGIFSSSRLASSKRQAVFKIIFFIIGELNDNDGA